MKGKEIALKFLGSVETNNLRYLTDVKDNERHIRSGKYYEREPIGCPDNYGLEEWEGLCMTEAVKDQCEQCRQCWIQALDKDWSEEVEL